MKGLSDNFLQKFDNLGLRNKEIDKQDEQQYNSQKKTASTRNIEKQELTIRDFNIYTTLGTGTFGRVRQVKLKTDKTNIVYALKMLKKTEIVRLNQVEHIKSEKLILENIDHPFIVR